MPEASEIAATSTDCEPRQSHKISFSAIFIFLGASLNSDACGRSDVLYPVRKPHFSLEYLISARDASAAKILLYTLQKH